MNSNGGGAMDDGALDKGSASSSVVEVSPELSSLSSLCSSSHAMQYRLTRSLSTLSICAPFTHACCRSCESGGRLRTSFSKHSSRKLTINELQRSGRDKTGGFRYGICVSAFICGISASGGSHSASSIIVIPRDQISHYVIIG